MIQEPKQLNAVEALERSGDVGSVAWGGSFLDGLPDVVVVHCEIDNQERGVMTDCCGWTIG